MTALLAAADPALTEASAWVALFQSGGPYLASLICLWFAWQERKARREDNKRCEERIDTAYTRLSQLTERMISSTEQLRATIEVLTVTVERGG